MKLNKESVEILRQETEKLLMNVNEYYKVKLPKDTLEMLLFNTTLVDLGGETKLIAKIPVWSGTFLRKLDLSEVSFENVSWEVLDESGISKPIDYSKTNANIDFSKSVEFMIDRKYKIVNCDFSGLNLSSNTIYLSSRLIEGYNGANIINNNFNGTGLSFELFEDHFSFNGTNNNFEGCYINGKLIKPKNERKQLALNALEEYEKYKQDIMNDIEECVRRAR